MVATAAVSTSRESAGAGWAKDAELKEDEMKRPG